MLWTGARAGNRRRIRRNPVGFQNSATGLDLGFYAARWYSFRRPVLVENAAIQFDLGDRDVR